MSALEKVLPGAIVRLAATSASPMRWLPRTSTRRMTAASAVSAVAMVTAPATDATKPQTARLLTPRSKILNQPSFSLLTFFPLHRAGLNPVAGHVCRFYLLFPYKQASWLISVYFRCHRGASATSASS